MLRITDALDSYRDLLSSTLDSYLSQVSNRLGSVSKGSRCSAALSIPFVVIAGVYGMNFEHIPLAHHRWGFEIMVVAQLACRRGARRAVEVEEVALSAESVHD